MEETVPLMTTGSGMTQALSVPSVLTTVETVPGVLSAVPYKIIVDSGRPV